MVGLGDLPGGEFASGATDVSADGRVVVGGGNVGPGGVGPGCCYEGGFRWTADGGMTYLGDLLGGRPDGSARAVSADGSVVVGYAGSAAVEASGGGYHEAFRWTEQTGMIGIGDLPGHQFTSWAEGISADGRVIVGASFSYLTENGRAEAFRWTAEGGMVGLEDLPGGELYSGATAASADGSVIVGQSSSGPFPTYEGVVWNEHGITGMGDFLGGRFIAVARSVSGDGLTVVGSGDAGVPDEYDSDTAFVWTRQAGLRDLKAVLESEYALDLGGWQLVEARDISADGQTIIGYGRDPEGRIQAWLVAIPEPSTFLMALAGAAAIFSLRLHKTAG